MKNLRVFIALIAIAVGSSSCERILDFQANSDSQIPADSAILNIQDAEELLVSVYDVAANAFNGRFQNIPEVMSDHIADLPWLSRPTSHFRYQKRVMSVIYT